MIKWAWYWKLLKQWFFTLLISCFILLGNLSDSFNLYNWMYVRENWTYWTSPYDFSYDVQVINKWNLLTNSIWLTARALYFRRWTYFTWKYSDYLWWVAPFLSYTSSWDTVYDNVVHQWFPTHYALCDYFWTWFDITMDLTWCVVNSLNSWSLITVANFMAWVSLNDMFSFKYDYDYSYLHEYNNWWLLVCFSSQYYNKTMCFWITRYTYYTDCVYPWLCVSTNNQWILFSWYWVALPWGFENLYRMDLSFSPWQSFVEWWLGAVENPDNTPIITWNYTYSTCTYWELIDEFNSAWWSKNYCYWWLDNFNDYDSSVNYNPIPWSWLTLNQIWANAHWTWSTPLEWFNFWNWLYKDSQFVAMWESYPAVYHTWFDLYYQYWWWRQNFNDVVEYCNIVLSLDSLSGSVYKWKQFDSVCKSIIDRKNNNLVWWSWEFIDWLNWGNWVKTQWNAVQFIQDFFNKAQEVIPTNYSDLWLGALPVYIITFFCALIFFRFLMHK